MGDLINLNKARKRAGREASAQQADANRARFGRTKNERARDDQRRQRIDTMLDQHRIKDTDAS